jgi:hypothetical protein
MGGRLTLARPAEPSFSLAFPRVRGIDEGPRQAPPKLGSGPAYIK